MSELLDVDIEALDRRTASRGVKAAVELEIFEEAFAKLKAAALEELVNTSPHQAEKRERLYQVASISEAVKAALKKIALDGEIARQALADSVSLRP